MECAEQIGDLDVKQKRTEQIGDRREELSHDDNAGFCGGTK